MGSWVVVRTVSVEDLSGEFDRCSGGESGAGGLQLVEQVVDEKAGRGERQAEASWRLAEVAPGAVAQLVAGDEQVGRQGRQSQFLRSFVELPQQGDECRVVEVGWAQREPWVGHAFRLPPDSA